MKILLKIFFVALGVMISSFIFNPCFDSSHNEERGNTESLDMIIKEQEKTIKKLSTEVKEAKYYIDMINNKEDGPKIEIDNKNPKEEPIENQEELDRNDGSIILSNGYYEAGLDFKEGKYDLIAISGRGNVISRNLINAIMGPSNEGSYQREYKNIDFPKGAILSIDGVKLRLVPKK